jgi:hypothetical protein
MDHRYFEDWLLSDQPLDAEQRRELQLHLRTCAYCARQAEVNLALRASKPAAPAPGFTTRWQARLAAQRQADRRRFTFGVLSLVFSGLLVLGFYAGPVAAAFAASPSTWIQSWAGYFISLAAMVKSFTQAISVLADIIPDFIPAYGWLVALSSIGGFILLWSVSIWKFTRMPKGIHHEVRA